MTNTAVAAGPPANVIPFETLAKVCEAFSDDNPTRMRLLDELEQRAQTFTELKTVFKHLYSKDSEKAVRDLTVREHRLLDEMIKRAAIFEEYYETCNCIPKMDSFDLIWATVAASLEAKASSLEEWAKVYAIGKKRFQLRAVHEKNKFVWPSAVVAMCKRARQEAEDRIQTFSDLVVVARSELTVLLSHDDFRNSIREQVIQRSEEAQTRKDWVAVFYSAALTDYGVEQSDELAALCIRAVEKIVALDQTFDELDYDLFLLMSLDSKRVNELRNQILHRMEAQVNSLDDAAVLYAQSVKWSGIAKELPDRFRMKLEQRAQTILHWATVARCTHGDSLHDFAVQKIVELAESAQTIEEWLAIRWYAPYDSELRKRALRELDQLTRIN